MNDHATSTAAAAGVWRRPVTLDELRADLIAFSGWGPIVRARRVPELIEAAKAVLADEGTGPVGWQRAGVAGGGGSLAWPVDRPGDNRTDLRG